MLLIYANTITRRLVYVCEFIFTRVIPCEYRLTAEMKELEQYKGPQLNYSGHHISDAVQLMPADILFEDTINAFDQKMISTPGGFALFPVTKGDTGFDVFAAVFFMISRYEEWLPYEADRHGRFEAKQSILYRHGCLHLPVVDQWCYHLKNLLREKFPGLAFQQRQFSYLSTIDVDNDYAYLGKPLYRTIGASVKDLLKGNLAQLRQRLSVLSGKQKDPFDAYAFQTGLARSSRTPLLYFFLTIEKQSAYDRAIPCNSNLFSRIVHEVKQDAAVGIHPSYFSQQQNKMREEKKQLEDLLGKPIDKSRQHFLHFDIRTSPQQLMLRGIMEDHTMGFASDAGFRAGTCTPFKYFDFHKNEPAELEMVPFCVMDSVFYDYLKKEAKEAEAVISAMVKAIQEVDGLFVSVWHDRSFSELHFPGWKALYEKLQVTCSS